MTNKTARECEAETEKWLGVLEIANKAKAPAEEWLLYESRVAAARADLARERIHNSS